MKQKKKFQKDDIKNLMMTIDIVHDKLGQFMN